MTQIGEVGQRLSDMNASEGAAGNISVYIGWEMEARHHFPLADEVEMALPVPELAGKSFLVTGSGTRLRDILQTSTANLGLLVVNDGGKTGLLYTSQQRTFTNITSEFNSHLGVHHDQVLRSGTNFHVLIHAQPPYITYLSHVPQYRDMQYLSRHVMRWQPEMIMQFPEGIGVIPFVMPGSSQLMADTVSALHQHRIVVWSKHGVMARSGLSIKSTCDLIEYLEAGSRYEVMDIYAGGIGEGLTDDELREICNAYNIQQNIF
ncbi:MAG: class II aldolase/adducin family protein [Chloroflexota bacterium]